MNAAVGKCDRLRKTTDEAAIIRCACGEGMIRIETWANEAGTVLRYNLAFINHHLFQRDHGRVLGYDTAHGFPHRHYVGRVENIDPAPYDVVYDRFIVEVAELKKRRHL
jgi:hypothetical protein